MFVESCGTFETEEAERRKRERQDAWEEHENFIQCNHFVCRGGLCVPDSLRPFDTNCLSGERCQSEVRNTLGCSGPVSGGRLPLVRAHEVRLGSKTSNARRMGRHQDPTAGARKRLPRVSRYQGRCSERDHKEAQVVRSMPRQWETFLGKHPHRQASLQGLRANFDRCGEQSKLGKLSHERGYAYFGAT